MAVLKVQGNASGSGSMTLIAPNTNSNQTIALPDTSGTLLFQNANNSLPTVSILETATITAAAPASTTNFDAVTQAVQYYTTNNANNWTLNLRGSSGVTMNSFMSTGQSLTIAMLTTNGATPYYMTAIQVDGVGQTIRWQGGTAPTAGNASAIDSYSVTLIKTASATYTVLAAQTQFK
jgi:hypothetical protein